MKLFKLAIVLLIGCLFVVSSNAIRIKDISQIQGVRSNSLIGYGLVIGLNGTGDQVNQAQFTLQSFKSMLTKFGIVLPPGQNPQLKNIAAVVVTAELPAFAKTGQAIDVSLGTIGNAKSLQGGLLLMTPLKGADGRVYAVAQGSVVGSGFEASGSDGSSITVNVPTSGRIPNGAMVENTIPNAVNEGAQIVFNLNSPDYTTSTRIVKAINDMLGPDTAQAVDAGSISVRAPLDKSDRVNFLAALQDLDVDPGEAAAKIVINSRTGTIVIGQHVTVRPAAVAHGSLTVTITEDPLISQPGALSGGTTQVVNQTNVNVSQGAGKMFLFAPGSSLKDIVRAVNGVGAAPGDLMAILEALKAVGALQAEIVVL